jgi:oligopeptide/dipeptide ABC transporter ATP-binding protein
MSMSDLLLQVRNLKQYYPGRKTSFLRKPDPVKAVDGIDLDIRFGETLALVGESGCGKTTVARAILRLDEPTSGKILFHSGNGETPETGPVEFDIRTASPNRMKVVRREIQLIFQDPYSSLNPRMTVGELVGEPLLVHGIVKKNELRQNVIDLLSAVGLGEAHLRRYPHEFSGGQRQRIGIARALALRPRLVVADEPVSALDVSIQAQVINLLADLQREFGLTYLFIAHDLSMVKYISDRVAVMYLGKIVETAETEDLFLRPRHPYTEALLSAVPVPDPRYKVRRIPLKGEIPSPINPPSGCRFHPRCPYAEPVCSSEEPALRDLGNGHMAACRLSETLTLQPVYGCG